MAVFESGMDEKGVYYLYYWLKLATGSAVKEARRNFLEDANRKGPLGMYNPLRNLMTPRKKVLSAGEKLPTLDIDIGFRIDPPQAEKASLVIDVQPMAPGFGPRECEEWLKTEGASWAANGTCILCHVSVEPNAA